MSSLVDVKRVIRALLVSNPNIRTIQDLYHEYENSEGEKLPFQAFNQRNALGFLLLMPDTVKVLDRNDLNSAIEPVMTEESAHVFKLVCQQKNSSTHRRGPPSRRSRRWSQVSRPFDPSKFVRQTLTNEFKNDLYEVLANYPDGMDYDEFDSHVRRLLGNHYLDEYTTEEVLNCVTEFAILNHGKVHSLKYSSDRVNSEKNETHDQEVIDLCSSDETIEISDDEELELSNELNHLSVSRPSSRCAKREVHSPNDLQDHPFDGHNLCDNLRSLFAEPENANGIWLTNLTDAYFRKFSYPLSPKEYGFSTIMEMVANLSNVFHMKRYRTIGDIFLLDARKHPQSDERNGAERGEIPESLIEKLKKLLRHEKQIYTEDFPSAYKRMFQQSLKPEEYGFKNMDSFLQHLEDSCREIIRFRQIVDRTVMKLNYEQTDPSESRRTQNEIALPGRVTYNPFPEEVCDSDFKLETDPIFDELKEGDSFEMNLGEVYTPEYFYVTHITRVQLLADLMTDLNEFYDCHEAKYKILPALVGCNLLCACVYSKTMQWHRVQITQVSRNLKTVKLLFVDYGTVEENVEVHKLRYLHKTFAEHPRLCWHAKLSGIQPKNGGSYDASVSTKFFIHCRDVDMEVKIVRKYATCLEVQLYTLVGENKESVQEHLINQGFVEPKSGGVSNEMLVQKDLTSQSQDFAIPKSDGSSSFVCTPLGSPDTSSSPGCSSNAEPLRDQSAALSDRDDTQATDKRSPMAFFNKIMADNLKRATEESGCSWTQQNDAEFDEVANVELKSLSPQDVQVQKPLPVCSFPSPPPPYAPPNTTSAGILSYPESAAQPLMSINVPFPYQAPYAPFYSPQYPYLTAGTLPLPPHHPFPGGFLSVPNYQFAGGVASVPNYIYRDGPPLPSNFPFHGAIPVAPTPNLQFQTSAPVASDFLVPPFPVPTTMPSSLKMPKRPPPPPPTPLYPYNSHVLPPHSALFHPPPPPPPPPRSPYSHNSHVLPPHSKSFRPPPGITGPPQWPVSNSSNSRTNVFDEEDYSNVPRACSTPKPVTIQQQDTDSADTKKLLELIVREKIRKMVDDLNAVSVTEPEEPKTKVNAIEEIRQIRAQREVESTLEEYLNLSTRCDGRSEGEADSSNSEQTHAVSEVYASESVTEAKATINKKNESVFSPIKEFVLNQTKSNN